MIVREYKKLFIRYILLLVAIPAMLLSCVYEEFDSSIGEVVEGEPATVSLTVQLPAMTSVTRAGGISPDSNEASHVNDLWVGIYNADTGERSGYYYDTFNEVFANDHDDSGHHTIEIKDAVSGRCYIVAVANVANNRGIDITGDEGEKSLKTMLESATTWEKYKNLAIILMSGPQSIAYSGPGMLMSGIYYDDAKDNHSSHNYQDVIDDDGNPNSGGAAPVIIRPGKNDLDGCVQLRRVAAYVKFNIQVSDAYKNIITFTPVSWQVCNLPGVSYVHERKGSDNAADKVLNNLPEDYESNSYHNSLIYDGIQLFPTRNGVSSFDFYQMENKHMAVGNLENYNEREAEYTFTTEADKGKNTGWYKSLVSEQDYSEVADTPAVPKYESPLANNNASYVIIRAHLEYYYRVNDDNYTPVAPPANSNDAKYIRRVGDAIYTIHLGYCEGKDNNQPTTATRNDFNCRRNTRYTYNIYVSGVDQIRVEAVAEGDGDGDKTNGVEGTVTDVTSNVISLDSHYGVFNIQMTDRERMDLSWRIQSPFGDDIIDMMHNSDKFENFDTPGIINLNSEANSDKVKALPINQFYNWVQFRPTSGENVLAHYPGDPRLIGREIENPDPQTGAYYDTSNIPDYATSGRTGGNDDDGTGVWYIEQLKNVADCPHTDVANNAGYLDYVRRIQAGENVTTNQVYENMLDNISRWYTVYVDEYVYEYNYNPGLPSLTGENDEPGYVNDVMDITEWRYFVNRPNRSLWIAINNSHTSSDMESIYSNASYFITQESIQTYYSNNADQGIGIECTNESYRHKNLTWWDYQFDEVDGLYNQYHYVVYKTQGVTRWFHVLLNQNGDIQFLDIDNPNFANDYAKLNNRPRVGVLRHGTDVQSDSEHTFYIPDHTDNYMDACLARNRDLNNDGIVGANEIRWYLPTTSTYTRIILGSTSLRSPLFNLTEFAPNEINAGAGTLYSHYLGSNNRIVWAEELAATGARLDWEAHGNLRCIRNLGQKMNLHPGSGEYDTIDAAYHHNEGTHTVELDFYNMTALRDYTNGTITAHPVGDIRSYAARKFQYAKEDCDRRNTNNSDRYLNEFGVLIDNMVRIPTGNGPFDFTGWWNILENNSVCGQYSEEPDGRDRGTWRVPNITELAIMKILNIVREDYPKKYPMVEDYTNRYISCSYEYFLNRWSWGFDYPDTQKFIMGVANNIGTFDISANIKGHSDMSVRCVRDVE